MVTVEVAATAEELDLAVMAVAPEVVVMAAVLVEVVATVVTAAVGATAMVMAARAVVVATAMVADRTANLEANRAARQSLPRVLVVGEAPIQAQALPAARVRLPGLRWPGRATAPHRHRGE